MNSVPSGGSGGRRNAVDHASDKEECENGIGEGSSTSTIVNLHINVYGGTLGTENAANTTATTASTPEIRSEASYPSPTSHNPSDTECQVPSNSGEQHPRAEAPSPNAAMTAPPLLQPPGWNGITPSIDQMQQIDDTIRILVETGFFRKRSDPSTSFETRETRPAYSLYDDCLKKEDHLFLYKLGKTGRFEITLQGLRNLHLPICVLRVSLRMDDCNDQPLEFVQKENIRSQAVVKALIDPSRLDCPRLHSVCPAWGWIDVRYVPMKILIDATVGADSTFVHRFVTTVFCKVVENRKTTYLYARQRIQMTWKEAPQSTRTVLRGCRKAVIAIPKGIANVAMVVRKIALPCG